MCLLVFLTAMSLSAAADAASIEKIGDTLFYGSAASPRQITNVMSNGAHRFSVLGNRYGPYKVVTGIAATYTGDGRSVGTFEITPTLADQYGPVPVGALNGTFDGNDLRLTWIERLADSHGVGLPHQYTGGATPAGVARGAKTVVVPPIDTTAPPPNVVFTYQELFHPSVQAVGPDTYLFRNLRSSRDVGTHAFDRSRIERRHLSAGTPSDRSIDKWLAYDETENNGSWVREYTDIKLADGSRPLVWGLYWSNISNQSGTIYLRKYRPDGTTSADNIVLVDGKSWTSDGFSPFGPSSVPGADRQMAAVATPDGGFALVRREGKVVSHGGGSNFYDRTMLARFDANGVVKPPSLKIHDGTLDTGGSEWGTIAVCPTLASLSNGVVLVATEVYDESKGAMYLTLKGFDKKGNKVLGPRPIAKTRYGAGVLECDGTQNPRGVPSINEKRFLLHWMDETANRGVVAICRSVD